jgi:hypothetical protein
MEKITDYTFDDFYFTLGLYQKVALEKFPLFKF